ncbi:unnamed protein product [Porites lobata]|uniref:Uncharacterized protein n=1 Tax=Porites lobata TaxID=104759 RepID=A0ABN8N9M1_9CNID|nr:unnamed protein product [Porites lobata]
MEATISPGRHLKGACSVTRQSGHPNFDCIHLQSVQYPHPFEKPIDLCGESLEERVGGCFNWFSIKQKDVCVAKGQQASELGSPLIFRFPCDKYEERHLLEDPTTETQQDYKTGERNRQGHRKHRC